MDNLIRIGATDLFFYYFAAGEKTTFNELMTFKLDSVVNGNALKYAVTKALGEFDGFSVRLKRHENNLYYEHNDAPAPVYKEDGRTAYFGSKDMNGYLFRVTYDENKVMFHVFHGLSDGRGVNTFAFRILDIYYREVDEVYARTIADDYIEKSGVEYLPDPYRKFVKPDAEPIWVYKNGEVYNIETERYENGDADYCRSIM
ncbi:MAG: hypothetical protein K6B41_10550, partial [Butyrivibrio sp.]|nr:hypothetical protein [Butyrivibrio sp.]